jgi:hypothetical protein
MTRYLFDVQVLQPQSTDIGSRWSTLATTRHRLLAGFPMPEKQVQVPCGGFGFPCGEPSVRHSHPSHGGDSQSHPTAKTADSRESFSNLE